MTYVEIVERGEGPRPYPLPVRGLVSGHVVLFGWAIKETSGVAVAELDLFDGTDNAGLLAVPIPLAAAGSSNQWLGPQGLHFRSGLFPVVTGALTGSVWYHLVYDAPADRSYPRGRTAPGR